MLNVVMLSVVAPFEQREKSGLKLKTKLLFKNCSFSQAFTISRAAALALTLEHLGYSGLGGGYSEKNDAN